MLRILCGICLVGLSGCSFYNLGTSYGDGCFAAGTPVPTVDGYRPIEKIAIDDQLVVYDEELKQFTIGIVETVMERQVNELLEVKFGETTIQVTADHPVLTLENQWQPIGQLEVGSELMTWHDDTKSTASINSINPITKTTTVYNFKVRRYHNAVVAGLVAHFY